MKTGFYPKLAWEGIRKNKRMYFPYILTGAVMVMMNYILSFLAESPALAEIKGGSTLMTVLPFGSWVIALFSLLFLFYTNSFLIRQRYREFGLYNVLGMDKRNISRIMVWESLFVALMAIVSGLAAGIALSKASELVLLNMLDMEINYKLSIGVRAIRNTPLVFGVIYLLLLISSIIKVRRTKPLELMKSSKVGERIPKRTWIFALLGVIFLGVAYYMAVSIEKPLTAFTAFFVAVLLVIVGTYLIFMSGSVALCKLLQKNKSYYYKPNHFVSVSSMAYRMKRNGAGLASICILLTMILVMLSSTASLYVGVEDMLRTRYPKDINLTATFDSVDGISDENIIELKNKIHEVCGNDIVLDGIRAGEIPGLFTQEGITIDVESHVDFSLSTYENVGYLSVISLEDYNRVADADETLEDGECLLYCGSALYEWDSFTVEYGKAYKVKKELTEFIEDYKLNYAVVPVVYMVVEDFDAFVEPVFSMKNDIGEPMIVFDWRVGFDMGSAEEEIAAYEAILDIFNKGDITYSYNVESREVNREVFFEDSVSLLFLGAMLSIVFLMAAVLIIYYKQISEGYEDEARFDIMQKVGMTKKDIKKSINSQMLTVFFSPLIFAGIHLCFAYPFILKILKLFGLDNQSLLIGITVICFVVFGLIYAVVYKITSSAYYSIVSGRKE